MRQQLEKRLSTLKAEYKKGQSRIGQLEVESASLRETMLRISGAILVLQELLSPPTPSAVGSVNEAAETTARIGRSASTRNDRHTAIDRED